MSPKRRTDNPAGASQGKSPEKTDPRLMDWLKVLLPVLGTIIAAVIGYYGIRTTTYAPMWATQTAQSNILTQSALLIESASAGPNTPVIAVTNTPEPSINTPTSSPTPPSGEFEESMEHWGEALQDKRPVQGQGVQRNCSLYFMGKCSLEFTPSTVVDGNTYVARTIQGKDFGHRVSIQVYIPSANLCLPNKCSTARVIVWREGETQPYEGKAVELDNEGQWKEITLDLGNSFDPDADWTFGVHFYLVAEYPGPFHIDSVVIKND